MRPRLEGGDILHSHCFVYTSDPVQAGFIKSLGQPGGNITGPISNPILIGKLSHTLSHSHDPARLGRWEESYSFEASYLKDSLTSHDRVRPCRP